MINRRKKNGRNRERHGWVFSASLFSLMLPAFLLIFGTAKPAVTAEAAQVSFIPVDAAQISTAPVKAAQVSFVPVDAAQVFTAPVKAVQASSVPFEAAQVSADLFEEASAETRSAKPQPSAFRFPKIPLPEIDFSKIDSETEKEKLREALRTLDEKGLSAEKIADRVWEFVSSRENQQKVGEAAGKARDTAENLIDGVTGDRETQKNVEQTGGSAQQTERQTETSGTGKTNITNETKDPPTGEDTGSEVDRITRTITDEAAKEIEKAANQAVDAAAEKAKEAVSKEIDESMETVKDNFR